MYQAQHFDHLPVFCFGSTFTACPQFHTSSHQSCVSHLNNVHHIHLNMGKIDFKSRIWGLRLYGFSHDEQTHEKHHNEKHPHEESV